MTEDECRKKTVELLREIITSHADPYDPAYNECDDAICAWCEDAQAVIDHLEGARATITIEP